MARVLDLDDGFTTESAPTLGLLSRVTGTRAAPTAIVAGTGVTVAGVAREIKFITGSGGAVDVTANPQVAAGTTGQELILIGRSDVNTVTLENGTGLALNGTCVLSEGSTLHLVYDGTNWAEVTRNDL